MSDRPGGESIVSRRRFLAATSMGTLSGMAGCSGLGGGGTGTGTTTTTTTTTPSPTETPSFSVSDCDSPETLQPADVAEGGDLSSGCYRAESTLEVESGTLTLAAGVQIEFAKNDGLEIGAEGGLAAEGTADAPVVLTGTKETRGHWKGLFFRGSDSGDNHLDRTLVQYAGGGSWNPNWKNGAIELRNGASVALNGSLLRENGRAGLVVRHRNDQLSLSDTSFESNAYPVRVHSNVAGAITPDNGFAGNDTDAIRIGIDGADTVSTEQTWSDPGVPYHADKHVEVDAPLSVAAGVTVAFAQTKGLNVRQGGRLTVEGTGDAPVRFTGHGDARGSWKGIRFGTSRGDENRLEHAVVEYAGDSEWNPNHHPAGLFLQGNQVSLTARNSTFRGNASTGLIGTGPQATLVLESNSFANNEVPLLVQANLVDGIAADNAFSNNDSSFVHLGAPGVGGAWTDVTDEATWPALSVPYRPEVNVGVEAPLTVDPGSSFAFEQGRGMRVRGNGRLTADASDGGPITFRGTEDITGFWRGLYFVNSLSSDNVLTNVVIENGGNGEWVGGAKPDIANLYLHGGDDAAAVDVSDTTIRGSGKYGIGIGNSDARVTTCSGMKYENNADADTYNLEAKAPISSCQ